MTGVSGVSGKKHCSVICIFQGVNGQIATVAYIHHEIKTEFIKANIMVLLSNPQKKNICLQITFITLIQKERTPTITIC